MTTEEFKDKQRKFAKYRLAAISNPTEAEYLVKKALDNIGVKYVFQKGFLREKTIRLVDFYFPSPNMVCLEVDGGYHKAQLEYDKYREVMVKRQRKNNLTFVRITNEWVFEQKNLLDSLILLLPFLNYGVNPSAPHEPGR